MSDIIEADRIERLNAAGVLATFDDFRSKADIRFIALENEVVTLRSLVQSQSQVIGEALQRLYGSGSTVAE